MALFLKNLVKSKAFKAIVLIVATALTTYASTGCARLRSSASDARIAKFNCQVDALQPVLGDVLDVSDLVRGLYLGSADLGAALSAVGATEAEVKALIDRLRACEAPAGEPLPDGEPS